MLDTAAAVPVKLADNDPAGTVTLEGTVKLALVLESATTAPPAPGAAVMVTEQLVEPAPVKLVWGHQMALTPVDAVGARLNSEVFETPPELAVSVAVVADVTAATAAVNVPVVDPAATVMLEGTVTLALLLDSVTLDPPAPAADVRVTVQLDVPAAEKLDGLHVRLLAVGTVPGASVIVVVLEVPA